MTPTETTIMNLADVPLWARSTLRRGLPGDGAPKTAREARRRCPHLQLVHIPLRTDRYWLAREKRPFSVEYATRRDRAGEHVRLGGWRV